MGRIAIISGGGNLPRFLAHDLQARGESPVVVGFEGQMPDWSGDFEAFEVPIERPGALVKRLKKAGCGRVVFAGGIRRPKVNPLRLDATGIKLAARVLGTSKTGDDAALRAIAQVFEDAGLTVIGPQQVAPVLLPPAGVLGRVRPSDVDESDVARAAELVASIGQLDVGQAAVVAQGLCLGLETLQGTDRMLEFVAATREGLVNGSKGQGVLYKAVKPTQDPRLDFPAIGPQTVTAAAAAGLAGIAFPEGGVMVLERADTIAAADKAGLFLWCRAAP